MENTVKMGLPIDIKVTNNNLRIFTGEAVVRISRKVTLTKQNQQTHSMGWIGGGKRIFVND